MNQPLPQPPTFGELDILRFMFELNHQYVDPAYLQKMVFDHHMRNQMQYNSLTPPPEAETSPLNLSPLDNTFHPNSDCTSTPGVQKVELNNIPEPRIIFNYVPSTRLPTPEPEDVKMSPDTTTMHDENTYGSNESSDKLIYSDRVTDWCGHTIYHNIPDVAMVEYDKLLRESHMMKVEVINKLHDESPINYDYNPNKSRIRTNYGNPMIAEGRTKNNIASRRSRQRKKFQQHILQYSVDFDEDENFLLEKQEHWLRAIIEKLEAKIVQSDGVHGAANVDKLRKHCGFQ